MSVEVLVPWAGRCAHRESAWEWLKDQYAATHQDLPVKRCEALRRDEGAPWVKARAVMPAIEASTADLVVVVDADVWCDGLQDAIDAVLTGAAWAMPHRFVFRLNEPATAEVFAGATDWWALELCEVPYVGVLGGGCVVAPRQTLLDIPLDPRFEGWGQEDESWGCALEMLLGPPKRIKRPLIHLYHPPAARLKRGRGSREGWALRCRYDEARRRNDRDAIRNLLEEARAHIACGPDQSDLLDHQAV